MRKGLFGILVSLVVLSSCSEDVDLSAPYKDITIAYGLLDKDDTTHYVRIQKAFLGDDNALLYCVIPDSLYYPATLDAYVLGYNGGVKVPSDSFHLDRYVNDVIKDSGIFAAFNNVIYKGTKILIPSHTYELVIIKPNGDTTRSSTELVNNTIMGYPPTPGTPLNWEPTIPGQSKTITIRWVTDANSYAYQLGIRFNYQEWEVGTPGNVTDTSFTYYFPMFKFTFADYSCMSNQCCYDITKERFYDMITQNIDEDPPSTPGPNIRQRRFIGLDFIVLQATQELYDYITINAPSLSYVQKVTAYTNITNGLGIWGSRTSGGVNGVYLNSQNTDSLMFGQYTSGLNFVP